MLYYYICLYLYDFEDILFSIFKEFMFVFLIGIFLYLYIYVCLVYMYFRIVYEIYVIFVT